MCVEKFKKYSRDRDGKKGKFRADIQVGERESTLREVKGKESECHISIQQET